MHVVVVHGLTHALWSVGAAFDKGLVPTFNQDGNKMSGTHTSNKPNAVLLPIRWHKDHAAWYIDIKLPSQPTAAAAISAAAACAPEGGLP